MQKIIIGEKEYEVNVTWGQMQKVFKKEARFKNKILRSLKLKHPDFSENEFIDEVNLQSGIPVSLIMIWGFLKKRWYGLKPFVFKCRMVNKIHVKEIKKAFEQINDWMSWEDREGKNLH